MTTPISEVDLVRSRRAAADGRYCTRCATSATACLVARLIAGSSFSARLTVAVETPSCAATSFRVPRPLTSPGHPRSPRLPPWLIDCEVKRLHHHKERVNPQLTQQAGHRTYDAYVSDRPRR